MGKYQRQTRPQRGQSKTFIVFFLLFFFFPPPIRKLQPLVETSCFIQRTVPTKSLRQPRRSSRRLLRPPPSLEPPSTAPCPASGQHICYPSARPWRQLGICFSLSEPTSGRAVEGQSRRGAVPLLSRRSDRAGSLVLHRNPPWHWPCWGGTCMLPPPKGSSNRGLPAAGAGS